MSVCVFVCVCVCVRACVCVYACMRVYVYVCVQHIETPAQHIETPVRHMETPVQHIETSVLRMCCCALSQVFAWKPVIINTVLQEEAYDLIFWLDAGCVLTGH